MPITRTITIGSKRKTRTKAPAEPSFKRKPNPKGKHLVVVESPAKAKTIEKILGPDYKVLASKGHLRDLPQKTLGVDIDDNFKPEYVNSRTRKTLSRHSRRKQTIAGTFIWQRTLIAKERPFRHLAKLLDVNPEDNVRIAFHEITAPAIKEAIKHPGPIDLNRVDAQQARRVLDRLVGYKLSPWLWKQVYRGLSAGRVQSVATRLICEREEEIRAFKQEEYWTIECVYTTPEGDAFNAKLAQIIGKPAELHNEEEAEKQQQASGIRMRM